MLINQAEDKGIQVCQGWGRLWLSSEPFVSAYQRPQPCFPLPCPPCPGQWRKEADDLLQSEELKAVFEENFAASDRGMKYPEYYTVRRGPRIRL